MEKLKFLIIPVMFIYFLVQNDNYSPKKNKAFALTGRQACIHYYPGRCPGLGASALYLSLRPVTVGSGLSYEFLSCISNVLSWFSSCRSTSLGLLP